MVVAARAVGVAVRHLIVGGLAQAAHDHHELYGLAGQGVVAIDRHAVGRDLPDGVDRHFIAIFAAAGELHADLHVGWKGAAGFSAHRILVEVTEPVFRLDARAHLLPHFGALDGRLKDREHATMPAVQISDPFLSLEERAAGVEQLVIDGDDGVLADFHGYPAGVERKWKGRRSSGRVADYARYTRTMTLPLDAGLPLLGGIDAARFMAVHWQKRPLFVAGAVPQAADVIDIETLFELAQHPEAQTRRIAQTDDAWSVASGPLRPRQLASKGRWTVLVQGINHFLPAADALLRRFAFIPYTRLDDVMASYATPGGGVGPHYDSYDVFLIQARGTRRWQISGQSDRSLRPGQPLKLMADFRAEQTFDCQPGDLLYLPPGYAHDGVAVDDCITLSVGFRAPSHTELAREFLFWMADRVELPGLYADPDRVPTADPAEVDAGLVQRVSEVFQGICWDERRVAAFLCQYLSEPKPHIVFDPPDEPLGAIAFARAARRLGVALDLQTLMLYCGDEVYCNGESLAADASLRPALQRLASQRFLQADEIAADLPTLLFPLYQVGQLHLAEPAR